MTNVARVNLDKDLQTFGRLALLFSEENGLPAPLALIRNDCRSSNEDMKTLQDLTVGQFHSKIITEIAHAELDFFTACGKPILLPEELRRNRLKWAFALAR